MEGNYVLDITFKAAADLSAKQYYAVKLSADNTVNVSGANERAIGILQNKPDTAGDSAVVRVAGVSKHKVNEAVGRGTLITSTSTGLGEEVDAAGEWHYAMALETSTSQNDIIDVLLTFSHAHADDSGT